MELEKDESDVAESWEDVDAEVSDRVMSCIYSCIEGLALTLWCI